MEDKLFDHLVLLCANPVVMKSKSFMQHKNGMSVVAGYTSTLIFALNTSSQVSISITADRTTNKYSSQINANKLQGQYSEQEVINVFNRMLRYIDENEGDIEVINK